MNADRWRQVEDCYHAALERPVPERGPFLAQACANDPNLRSEVESLLAHEGHADELLESPAWNHVTPSDETGTFAPGTLSAGSMMAEYRIAGRLGAGGMGEVYRATDTKLQREVALKVLASEFAQNDTWMSRFQREARVLASLNHPHIAAIYGLEESGGVSAIAMELVEGPTLAERLERGRIPVPEALAIAEQIAEALEYAHEKGIVHRDLKPANVKLRPDGVVKVLDFGLAKDVNPREAPLATATGAGVVMGTPAYMAPEQAAGLPVDRRADIWAFGVVLFEMLAGRPVYARKTTLETMAAVARDEPPWNELASETPTAILWLLRRCLDKDPKRRLRDIGEARIVLEDRSEEVVRPSNPASRWRFVGGWIVAGLLAAALAVTYFRQKTVDLPLGQFSVLPPQGATLLIPNGPTALALSPDGRQLVFVAASADGPIQLWLRSLDSMSAHPLTGTEGASLPFWSPDGRFVGFSAAGKLKKIDRNGGPPVTLCDSPDNRGGTWNRDGTIVFAPVFAGPLSRVAASGGAPTPVTSMAQTGGMAHRFPWFLPDGRRFLFAVAGNSSDDELADHLTVRVGSLDSLESKVLLEADSNAAYAQGHLLYLRENTLMSQPFDWRRLTVTGDPVRLAEPVQRANRSLRGIFAVSESGLLAYQAGASSEVLVWFDRSGNRVSNLGEAGFVSQLNFSPDREHLSMSVHEREHSGIWLYEVRSGRRTRFTFGPGEGAAVWSPDGRSIVFSSSHNGHNDLYRKASDLSGTEELLYADGLNKVPVSWSPDGKRLLYAAAHLTTGSDLWVLPLTPAQPGGALKPVPFLQAPFDESAGQFSPDGRWISYQANESGRSEIYVAPFRAGGPPLGRRQVSTAGGSLARWRRDGKEIYYVSPDARLMAAQVSVKGDALEIGEAHALFGRLFHGVGFFYDVSADGRRFLAAVPSDQRGSEPFTIVQNWLALLGK